MGHRYIALAGKDLAPRRAVINPDWESEKVLTSDLWMYVDLWIRRNVDNKDAILYWTQAKHFYKASRGLPANASPLVLYYCFLNATKALLLCKGKVFDDWHGVTGSSDDGKTSLSKQKIEIKNKGVLPSLMSYYGDANSSNLTLKSLFQNMAFIHRAYCLSYTSSFVFFTSIDPVFLRSGKGNESWVSFGLESKFNKIHMLDTLPCGYKADLSFEDKLVIRKTKRFRWKYGADNKDNNIAEINKYHSRIRRDLTYISGANKWYLKRRTASLSLVNMHTPVLIFAAMHRLSELSRYDPLCLNKLLDSQRNWVLAEFINTAPTQFLDEIACEITGQEIFAPDIHNGNSLSVSSV